MSDWKMRLMTTLEAGQQPSYVLLEESVHELLKERSALVAGAKAANDMVRIIARSLAPMFLARAAGDTEGALRALDTLMADHIVVTSGEARPNVH